MWLKPLMVPIATFMDDWLANGMRNPVKKWWFDHELVNRDIDPDRKVDPSRQKMAIYHTSMMPPPNEAGPVEVDRKAAMAAVDLLETPSQAQRRSAAGGAAPPHYAPTAPVSAAAEQPIATANPYK